MKTTRILKGLSALFFPLPNMAYSYLSKKDKLDRRISEGSLALSVYLGTGFGLLGYYAAIPAGAPLWAIVMGVYAFTVIGCWISRAIGLWSTRSATLLQNPTLPEILSYAFFGDAATPSGSWYHLWLPNGEIWDEGAHARAKRVDLSDLLPVTLQDNYFAVLRKAAEDPSYEMYTDNRHIETLATALRELDSTSSSRRMEDKDYFIGSWGEYSIGRWIYYFRKTSVSPEFRSAPDAPWSQIKHWTTNSVVVERLQRDIFTDDVSLLHTRLDRLSQTVTLLNQLKYTQIFLLEGNVTRPLIEAIFEHYADASLSNFINALPALNPIFREMNVEQQTTFLAQLSGVARTENITSQQWQNTFQLLAWMHKIGPFELPPSATFQACDRTFVLQNPAKASALFDTLFKRDDYEIRKRVMPLDEMQSLILSTFSEISADRANGFKDLFLYIMDAYYFPHSQWSDYQFKPNDFRIIFHIVREGVRLGATPQNCRHIVNIAREELFYGRSFDIGDANKLLKKHADAAQLWQRYQQVKKEIKAQQNPSPLTAFSALLQPRDEKKATPPPSQRAEGEAYYSGSDTGFATTAGQQPQETSALLPSATVAKGRHREAFKERRKIKSYKSKKRPTQSSEADDSGTESQREGVPRFERSSPVLAQPSHGSEVEPDQQPGQDSGSTPKT